MANDAWIFGYGSLMWNPGFAFQSVEPARLYGYHRRLCVYSHIYRGTTDNPGLVAGLIAGGSCWGQAYRVTADAFETVMEYLDRREMIYGVYSSRKLTAQVAGRRQIVTTYVADPAHAQFAGKLSASVAAQHVRQCEGKSGTDLDYLENLIGEMAKLGIHDRWLSETLTLARDD